MILILVLLVVGIVLIVKGGDFFVDAASWIAEVSGIPKVIIGATIVSLATTLPELLVSLLAAAQGKVDMAIGNAVGSVTANLGLIMAIGLICIPAIVKRKEYALKSVFMLAGCALVVICGRNGEVKTYIAVVMLAICALFFVENIINAKKAVKAGEETRPPKPTSKTTAVNVLKLIGGAAGIIIGANLLVNNGSELARLLGVSERIISVTIVAVGTSLPELVTTITAVAKKQSALSVGNIIGANIIDLTLIMPLCSVVSGKNLPVSASVAALDLPISLIVGAIALIPMLIASRFRRWQGFALLGVYAVYLVLTCTWVH